MSATAALELVAWVRDVEEWRREKDDFFRDGNESPLAPEDRANFSGLPYFPPDPAWRRRALIVRDSGRKLVKLVPSRGLQAGYYLPYARATIRFPNGAQETLTLFAAPHEHGDHAAHEPDELFLPFRDGLAGSQTYPTGRYLEVSNPLAEGQTEGETVIDFNFAYNPFCAYNDGYVCPLPPQENWLRSPVPAGERLPPSPAEADATGPPSGESD